MYNYMRRSIGRANIKAICQIVAQNDTSKYSTTVQIQLRNCNMHRRRYLIEHKHLDIFFAISDA